MAVFPLTQKCLLLIWLVHYCCLKKHKILTVLLVIWGLEIRTDGFICQHYPTSIIDCFRLNFSHHLRSWVNKMGTRAWIFEEMCYVIPCRPFINPFFFKYRWGSVRFKDPSTLLNWNSSSQMRFLSHWEIVKGSRAWELGWNEFLAQLGALTAKTLLREAITQHIAVCCTSSKIDTCMV